MQDFWEPSCSLPSLLASSSFPSTYWLRHLTPFCPAVCSVAWSCLTLCNPMDWAPPGFSVRGIFQARILEWVAFSSSRASSQPRGRTHVSCLSCIGRWVLYHWAKVVLLLFHLSVIFLFSTFLPSADLDLPPASSSPNLPSNAVWSWAACFTCLGPMYASIQWKSWIGSAGPNASAGFQNKK